MIIDNNNFKNIDLNTDDILVFDSNISVENFKLAVSNIFTFETENNIQHKFSFNDLSFEHRIILLEYVLNDYNIKNIQIIFNIINFIKSYNLFSDDYFSSDFIIVNSLEELLDFKLRLKDLLDNYTMELSKWYVSIFKSVHKLELNFLDNAQDIPASFLIIFQNFDFYTLSGILSKSLDFKLSECYLIKDAYAVLSDLCSKHVEATAFFEQLQFNS